MFHFFCFCALLLANDRSLGPFFKSTINLANPRESFLRSFAEAELSLGGLQRVCVLVFLDLSVKPGAAKQGVPQLEKQPPLRVTRTDRGVVRRVAPHFDLIEVRVVALTIFAASLSVSPLLI